MIKYNKTIPCVIYRLYNTFFLIMFLFIVLLLSSKAKEYYLDLWAPALRRQIKWAYRIPDYHI